MFLFIFFLCLPLLLVGLCDFLHYLRLLLINPKREPKKIVVCKICSEEDLFGIERVYEKMRWHGKYFADKLICVYSGNMNNEILLDYKEKGIVFLREDDENSRIFKFGDNYGESRNSRHSRENYISKP